LTLINTDTGELSDCENCTDLLDTVAGHERTIRSQSAIIGRLSRDPERSAREHELWDVAETLFRYWRVKCKHPKSRFSADRFWAVHPFLNKDGEDLCRRAIDGAAFDPFTKPRRNGSMKRFDDFTKNIFKDRATFEEMVNRSPIQEEK
jgi:hypothetical protein